MKYYVIEVLDTAEQLTPANALDILSFAFRGEVLSVQEVGAHPIYQTIRQALVSISVNGNELDFDSAEYANSIINQITIWPTTHPASVSPESGETADHNTHNTAQHGRVSG